MVYQEGLEELSEAVNERVDALPLGLCLLVVARSDSLLERLQQFQLEEHLTSHRGLRVHLALDHLLDDARQQQEDVRVVFELIDVDKQVVQDLALVNLAADFAVIQPDESGKQLVEFGLGHRWDLPTDQGFKVHDFFGEELHDDGVHLITLVDS
eukprot:CAMPEP_0170482588 /NCGR_PEP_ID=MMETSP0208-20121228/2539_1 /TAXON_ID=197538 /ORGANISM="Strombidium inclinatum, Strain S3" /LENGTH=153 /DNA_ID=CAMNT_0010755441 /DNA_START=220 /DNA_END=681 /DNA_ORIENTATION=-